MRLILFSAFQARGVCQCRQTSVKPSHRRDETPRGLFFFLPTYSIGASCDPCISAQPLAGTGGIWIDCLESCFFCPPKSSHHARRSLFSSLAAAARSTTGEETTWCTRRVPNFCLARWPPANHSPAVIQPCPHTAAAQKIKRMCLDSSGSTRPGLVGGFTVG